MFRGRGSVSKTTDESGYEDEFIFPNKGPKKLNLKKKRITNKKGWEKKSILSKMVARKKVKTMLSVLRE